MSMYPAIWHVAQAFPQQAASVLVSSVWEGMLLFAATGLFLRLLPQTTARFRFLIWSAVFLLLTALPVLNLSLASHSTGAANAAQLKLDPRWSYALTGFWLAAIAIRAAHLAVQAIKLRTLWNSAVRANFGALASLAPVLGKVQICTSTELDRPSVIGFLAPRILIPAWLFDQLTPAELHQIVLHELEHLNRRDDWLNLLQKLGLVIFPLNPALFWIDRRLSTERELACDDGVLEQTRAPRAYATVLTSLAERRLAYRSEDRLTALALGAVGAFRRSEFSRRIESIIDKRPTLAPAPFRTLLAVAVVGMLGFATAATHAPQLVSFSANPQQQAVVSPSIDPASTIYTQPATATTQARFLNASLRVPIKAVPPPTAKDDKTFRKHPVNVSHKNRKAVSQTFKTVQTISAPQPERHWMVLTSWHETAPMPVYLTLPDGRTFFVTYPATPTQVDWLLVQL